MSIIDEVITENFKRLVKASDLLYSQMEMTFMGPLPTDEFCFPFIILGSFACELGIKKVLEENNIQYSYVHDLKTSFALLPSDLKNQIINNIIGSNDFYKVNDLNHFYQLLDCISNNFYDWRYMHEQTKSEPDPTNPNKKIINTVHSSPVFIKKLYSELLKLV